MLPAAATGPTLASLLTDQGVLPLAEGLSILRQLAVDVRALHGSGRIHGIIGLDAVLVDEAGKARLVPAELAAAGSSENCPPELLGHKSLRLPAEIPAAREALIRAGIALEPVRIDIYQLGGLLCRLLTGQPAASYLRSPKVKAQVPAAIQPVIERCLGFSKGARFDSCGELIDALDVEMGSRKSADTPRGSPAGPGSNTPTHDVALPGEADTGLPFSRLGHYDILRRIGRGGMGDVYLAYEPALSRHVAIKVLPGELARNQDFVRRFQAEAAALARLAHPNIVPVFFIGMEGTHHYFVMPFVEGESLDRRLAREGRLEVDAGVALIGQCLAGLGAAHQAGLVHRDVKPGNILIEQETGRALVADFGLVMTAGTGAGLTPSGMILGTVDYIAPEQARGRKADGRSDLYSLGVVAYQILSGRLPFQAESPSVMIYQHAYEQPLPLLEAAPWVPVPLAAIVAKLMAKGAAERYASAQEALADMRRWQDGQPTCAALPGPDVATPLPGVLDLEPVGDTTPRSLRQKALAWLRGPSAEERQRLAQLDQQVDAALAEFARRRDRIAPLHQEAAAEAEELAEAGPAARLAPFTPAQQAPREAFRYPEQRAARKGQHAAQLRSSLDQLDQALLRLKEQKHRITRARQQRSRQARGRWLAVVLAAGLSVAAVALMLSDRSESPASLPDSSQAATPPAPDPPPVAVAAPDRFQFVRQTKITKATRVIKQNFNPQTLAFSPDSRTILAGNETGTISQYEVLSGKEIRSWKAHRLPVRQVAFSRDGKRILTASDDMTIRLWDAATAQEIRVFTGHTARVSSAVFSPDGTRILSSAQDSTARVWDVQTGKELLCYWAGGIIHGVAIAPSGKVAFTCDDALKMWDLTTGASIQSFPPTRAMCIAVLPDGNQALTGGFDKTLHFWDLDNKKEIGRLHGNTRPITGIAVSGNGCWAITCSHDNTVRICDLARRQEMHLLLGHSDAVNAVAVSPDSRWFASAGNDRTIQLWGAGTIFRLERVAQPIPAPLSVVKVEKLRIRAHQGAIHSLAVLPDGLRAISAAADRTARLWDLRTGKELARLAGNQPVTCLALSSDGKQFLTGGADNCVRLWDLKTGKELLCLKGHASSVDLVAFSPDGLRAVSIANDLTQRKQGILLAWDLTTGKQINHNETNTNTWPVDTAWCGDGHWFAFPIRRSPLSGSHVFLWNPEDTILKQYPVTGHTDTILNLAVSPDGKHLLTGSDLNLILSEAVTGKVLRNVALPGIASSRVAFSPDGKFALTAGGESGKDGKLAPSIHLWDLAHWYHQCRFDGQPDPVTALAFCPDGSHFLTGDTNGTIRLWQK